MKTHIEEIVLYLTNKDDEKLKEKMRNIFYINDNRQCMIGHTCEFYVHGWICDFYVLDTNDPWKTLSDFPAHLPYVPYEFWTGKSMHSIITGLTNSTIQNNRMISAYGKIHIEITNKTLFDLIKK